ncbi:uncharacterized protein [Antedon mediterranea]|uniref:uncharacterized protein n=1 Tax=Antedon mediterranea TaxID=105859 RepID=UPI003AF7C629
MCPSWLVMLVFANLAVQVDSFGEAIEDVVVDERFRKVGKAYVDRFDIVNNALDLLIITEDTVGVHEIWVVDFEPYDIIPNITVIEMDTGDVFPENSGECSNVIKGGPFIQDVFENGALFDDEYNLEPVQYTTLALKTTAPKKLFMTFSRDDPFIVTDVYNDNVTRRQYKYEFTGDFELMFNCSNRLGNSIWSYGDTQTLIEFKSTVYFTNVRPVDNTDGTKGLSFVSTSANLYYSIYRIAMTNFIISSEPLVELSIDYVIISPYVVAEVAVPNAAHIQIRFRTTIESPEGELLIFEPGTIEYEPMDNNNSLNTDFAIVSPMSAIPCDQTGICEQLWDFELVLDVRENVVANNEPIDATGVFKFMFRKHRCTDSTTVPANCVDLNEPALTISMEITIQTVVTVADSETDKPQIMVVSLTGYQNDNLIQNGGTVRGVNHMEKVKYKVRYTPTFLYDRYELMLTLFMVCRGITWADEPEGCLAANVVNRYIAYYHDDFEFSYKEEGVETVYNLDSLMGDAWSPEGDNTTQQVLTFNGAEPSDSTIYRMDFVNTALSSERDQYVITTVFRLVAKTERKRREISSDDLDSKPLILNTVPANVHHVDTRSIDDSLEYPAELTIPFEFAGCPENAHFVADELNCECSDARQQYSDSTFQCETIFTLELPLDETDDDITGSGTTRVHISSLAISFQLFVFITLKYK